MSIEFKTETIKIISGEMIIFPKGVTHKPFTNEVCEVMLVEPKGVLNTAYTKGDFTAPNNQWV